MKPDSVPRNARPIETRLSQEWIGNGRKRFRFERYAAAMLIASEAGLKQHKLKPLARVVSGCSSRRRTAHHGHRTGRGSQPLPEKAGLSWNDIGILELNEAFAAQSLACIRSWGLADDDPRINPNGGAIALGHPSA